MGESSFSDAGRPKQYAFFLPCSSTCVCCLYLLFTCKGFVTAKENAARSLHQLAAPGESGFMKVGTPPSVGGCCKNQTPLDIMERFLHPGIPIASLTVSPQSPLRASKRGEKFRGSSTLGSSDQTVHFSLDTSTVGGWRAPTPS